MQFHKKNVLTLATFSALALSINVHAQSDTPDAPETVPQANADEPNRVCLYANKDFTGDEWCYAVGAVPQINGEDEAAGIRLYGNTYVEVYQHPNYMGDSTTIAANTYNLDHLNDDISSIIVKEKPSNDFVCLFEHPGYNGTPDCWFVGEEDGKSEDLEQHSVLNNQGSSIIVSGNAQATLYDYSGYSTSGQFATVNRSLTDLDRHPEAGSWLEDRVSSVEVSLAEKDNTFVAMDLNQALTVGGPVNLVTHVGTHNSYNSNAYWGSLFLGANQKLTLLEQLEMGVRFMEMDVYSSGTGYVEVCHSVDCNTDAHGFRRFLAEIDTWFKQADDNDYLIMMLEDGIKGDVEGYEALARDIEWLGDIVYIPSVCEGLPDDIQMQKILDTGARVLIYNSAGSAGCDLVSGMTTSIERRKGIQDFDFGVQYYNPSHVYRVHECHNNFCKDTVDTDEIRTGILRGVNTFGLDQVDAGDERIAVQNWTFDPTKLEQPYEEGRTAVVNYKLEKGQSPKDIEYFFDLAWEDEVLPFLCRNKTGSWRLTQYQGVASEGAEACAAEFEDRAFDAPISYKEAMRMVRKFKKRPFKIKNLRAHVNFGVENGRWKAGKWLPLGERLTPLYLQK